jgi:hypothetical protein
MSSTWYHTRGYPWVAHALSLLSSKRYGRVSSNSATDKASKFDGLHISRMCQYIIKCLFIRAQLTWALIDTGGDYHFGARNLWSRPLILLPIQYSPLFPNCPVRSLFLPTSPQIHLNHIEPPVNRGPYRERLSTTRLISIAYTTKHSILSFIFFHRGK